MYAVAYFIGLAFSSVIYIWISTPREEKIDWIGDGKISVYYVYGKFTTVDFGIIQTASPKVQGVLYQII